MSEHKKPSELNIVQLHGGEIVTELTPIEELVQKWISSTYRGAQILDLPPQKWKVPGWLPSDSLVVLYAAPGVGKSFYALTLAVEMARGGEWLGSKLDPVPVLYVAAERLTTLRDRGEAWTVHNGEMLPDNLLMPEYGATPQLTNPIHVAALCAFIKAEGVRFVVLDTYAMMTQGLEENSSAGVPAEALGQIRKATNGGTVFLVHHSGKDKAKGMRGSTALLAAVDMTIELSGDSKRLKAAVQKSNAGAVPIPEWYELKTIQLDQLDDEPRSSAVLLPTGAPKKDPGLMEMVLEILRQESGGFKREDIEQALREIGRPVHRETLQRTALRPLLDSGQIVTVKVGRTTYYLIGQ